jgi:hypothetical protein
MDVILKDGDLMLKVNGKEDWWGSLGMAILPAPPTDAPPAKKMKPTPFHPSPPPSAALPISPPQKKIPSSLPGQWSWLACSGFHN